jgi:hypothetical protein
MNILREADEVIMSMNTDPSKKPKSLKTATKEAVAKAVKTGDPSEVVQFIKQNKKDFISGVYSSVFMASVRKQMTGNSAAVAILEKSASSNGAETSRAEKRALPREEGSNKRAKTSNQDGESKEAKTAPQKKSEGRKEKKDIGKAVKDKAPVKKVVKEKALSKKTIKDEAAAPS